MTKPTPTSPHRPNRISRGAHSDRGLQREYNEDAYALPPAGADEAGRGTLLVVADGVGGVSGGAAASQEAVHYLQAFYYAQTGPDQPGDRLRQGVEAVNLLNRAAQQRLGATGERLTTLVAAVVYNDTIWVANVGDSRAYLVQAGDLQPRQLTEDHGLGGAGLDYEPIFAGERSGAITQAIGLEEQCQADTYRYQWQPGDHLILCSDGLTSVPLPVMAQLVSQHPPQAAAAALVAQANRVDGSDNSTVIVAGWEKSSAGGGGGSGPQGNSILMSLLLGLILGWLSLALFLLYL